MKLENIWQSAVNYMNKNYITKIALKNKEILGDLAITLPANTMTHLIVTGKNGSGKTTLLKYIKEYLEEKLNLYDGENSEKVTSRDIDLIFNEVSDAETINDITINIENSKGMIDLYKNGNFIICYLDSLRTADIDLADGVEAITLKDSYGFEDKPYKELLKYMIHLKTQQSFAKNENDVEVENTITRWFDRFYDVLKQLWDNESLILKYDYRRYDFKIQETGKQEYNFAQLSDGYSSILRIFADIMMRMERNWLSRGNHINAYDLSGIVIIDEIETHLHIALQKSILPCLIKIFPNVQFIVSTHSPYVLNSVDNSVIYDLENHVQYNDFSMYSAEEISESYFEAEQFSKCVGEAIEEYKHLLQKTDASEDEKVRRASLRHKLKSLPRNIREELFDEFDKLEKRD